jgi:hypothetical protein
MSVGHGLKVAERNHKIKPPVVRDRGPNLVAGGGIPQNKQFNDL